MTIRDTYPVTVVNGDQLDDGYFNGLLGVTNISQNRITNEKGTGSTTSATYETLTTLATPTSLIASQNILVECWARWPDSSSGIAQGIKLRDDTGAADISEETFTTGGNGDIGTTEFLVGTIVIAGAAATKSVLLQGKTASGTLNVDYYLRMSLIE